MAECVVARCVQERRFLKRELQKWGKNVPYLVGLERVAQEMMGLERWTKLSQPLSELETNEIADWNPDDRCYFCNNWKTTSLDSTNGGSTLVDGSFNDYLSDQEQGTFSRGVSRSSSPVSVDSDQPLDLSIGNRTRSQSPNGLLIDGEMIMSSVAALLKVPHIPDKSGYNKNRKTKKLKRPVRVESSSTVCKRSYTEDELQAALQDIRSGKLGTRRAAVIYGIPRSTLRNKVYKLALVGDKAAVQDSCKSSKVDTTIKNKTQINAIDRDSSEIKERSDKETSASESLRRLLRNRISENLENHHLQQSLYDNSHSSMLASLESNPALAPILSHVLANVHQLALMSLQGGGAQSDDDAKDVPANIDLPLLPELIRKLSEKRFEEECNRHRSSSAITNADSSSPATIKTENGGSTALATAASVILKIPSYKPVKTVHNSDPSNVNATPIKLSNCTNSNAGDTSSSNGTKVGGATLREIIAKNITQRVNKNKQAISSHAGSTVATSNGSVMVKKPRTMESPSSVSASTSASSHSLRSSLRSSKLTISCDANKDVKHEKRDKPEKRSRPKRGRYRNYDRDNLVEAVRAVQRGEMSVHRAGSFYGVPHSTLEYKVKERHLLRPRKHRLGISKSGKSTHAISGKAASSSSSTCSSSSCSTSSTVSSMKTSNNGVVPAEGSKSGKELAPASETSAPNHVVSSDGAAAATTSNEENRWSNSSLFALDFSCLNSSNFFASQMMRKLQEDALTQGSRTGDNLSSRDALLLGVLLRNGLQVTESSSTSK